MAEPGVTTAGPALDGSAPVLRFALVNAMGDAALAITEQRFARLLSAAFPDHVVELRCYTLPAIARGEMAAARIARHYGSLDELRAAQQAAVIFTGAEPLFADLKQEVFWPALIDLFDWVRASNVPALFSCLAAHAAVLHFAGVPRCRLERKCFGIFAQTRAHEDPLTHGLPDDFAIAHSRWNELPEAALASAGFHVLTRGAAGVDAFVLPDAPMLFFQGHPEYEQAALDSEYRRDLRRFDSGAMASPPFPPELSGAPEEMQAAGHAFSVQLLRNFLGFRREASA